MIDWIAVDNIRQDKVSGAIMAWVKEDRKDFWVRRELTAAEWEQLKQLVEFDLSSIKTEEQVIC